MLVPTVLIIAIGILMLCYFNSAGGIALAVVLLTLSVTGLTGYILGAIFVGKGASLVLVQHDNLSSVSHELRTPLTSIRLLIESLRTNRLSPEEQTKVLALLSQETLRLDELVGWLLELSKLESKRHVYRRDPIDLAEVIQSALASYDVATLSAPTPVKVTIESPVIVIGDETTLVRAIANLLINAWKYTDADKRISLTARTVGRWVEVTITDNGIGMTAPEQRTVFQRFARGQAAIDRRTPGVGLGLAFVRAIVRGHRGKIDVTSQPGHGSSFRLRLRRARQTNAWSVRPPVDSTAKVPLSPRAT